MKLGAGMGLRPIRAKPFSTRWVRCVGCYQKEKVPIGRKYGRLRNRVSACCGAAIHPLNWGGWHDGRA